MRVVCSSKDRLAFLQAKLKKQESLRQSPRVKVHIERTKAEIASLTPVSTFLKKVGLAKDGDNG